MNPNRVTVLDIPFDAVTLQEALQIVLERVEKHDTLRLEKTFFMATPNPEMLLEARKNDKFRSILQKTNLNIADGTGIIFAAIFLRAGRLPQRVTGTDLMIEICKLAQDKKIFLLGGGPGVAEKTQKVLEEKYGTNVVGTDGSAASPEHDEDLRRKINAASPDILFVAFGAPKQEMWLDRNLPHLKTVKAAVGVGGAFDFISGKAKRAPRILRKLGLEWLYRLIRQPSRIGRIFNATVRFPLAVLKSAFTKKDAAPPK